MKEKYIPIEIMTIPTEILSLSAEIEDVLYVFSKKHTEYIIINDDNGMFRGIVTLKDIVYRMSLDGKLDGHIEDYINSENFVVLEKNNEILYFGEYEGKILCICENGKLVGVIDEKARLNWYEWHISMLQNFEKRCEEYELIFKNYYDSIYDINHDGTIIFASPATERIIGKRPEEIIGKNIREIEAERIYFPSVVSAVLKDKETVTIVQNVKEDGKAVVTGIPVFDEEGKLKRIITATRDVSRLVENLQHDSSNEIEELKLRLKKKEKEAERYFSQIRDLRKEKNTVSKINAKNSAMRTVLDLARKIAPTDSNVLILGESGTGKDLIATMIHNLSTRANGPFVKINCGAIPENILESELFGYEEGSFTGALKNGKAGLLEIADGGTVFLNEIGEMPLNLQVKLLQAIQDRRFMRVGGRTEKKVDIRIISATNKNLLEAVKAGAFREDLYYRLNVVPIVLPPLRNRKEDIPELSLSFLDQFNKKHSRGKHLSSAAMTMLLNYEWPGNVRELENLIERLVIVSEGDIIGPRDFPENMQKCIANYANMQINFDENKTLKESIEAVEREILKQGYEKYKNTIKLGKILDVNQSTIARKLKKYGLYDEIKRQNSEN